MCVCVGGGIGTLSRCVSDVCGVGTWPLVLCKYWSAYLAARVM